MVLDQLDRDLLDALRQDARLSYRALARRTGTTAPTVAARVRRLEQLGVIRGYTVLLEDAAPDLPRDVEVTCHWCKRATPTPIETVVAGVLHPFCCTTCRGAYLERHAALERGT